MVVDVAVCEMGREAGGWRSVVRNLSPCNRETERVHTVENNPDSYEEEDLDKREDHNSDL